MHRFNHHFLRIFVALLAAVFIANTVYAGGMMVSANLNELQQNQATEQAHTNHQHQHDSLSAHEDTHKPASHGGCKHCNHCLACYSMLLPQVFNVTENANKPMLAISLTTLYLSPTSPQLQKPPIA